MAFVVAWLGWADCSVAFSVTFSEQVPAGWSAQQRYKVRTPSEEQRSDSSARDSFYNHGSRYTHCLEINLNSRHATKDQEPSSPDCQGVTMRPASMISMVL